MFQRSTHKRARRKSTRSTERRYASATQPARVPPSALGEAPSALDDRDAPWELIVDRARTWSDEGEAATGSRSTVGTNESSRDINAKQGDDAIVWSRSRE